MKKTGIDKENHIQRQMNIGTKDIIYNIYIYIK